MMYPLPCEKCKRGRWDVVPCTLKGEYHASLCVDCRNAWHQVCENLPLVNELYRLEMEGADIVTSARGVFNPGAVLAPLRQRAMEINNEMCAIARTWVHGDSVALGDAKETT